MACNIISFTGKREPELYDAVQLQCHATLSALLQEHDPKPGEWGPLAHQGK